MVYMKMVEAEKFPEDKVLEIIGKEDLFVKYTGDVKLARNLLCQKCIYYGGSNRKPLRYECWWGQEDNSNIIYGCPEACEFFRYPGKPPHRA